jgi:hypothetical protein
MAYHKLVENSGIITNWLRIQALLQTGREFRHYHKLAENSGIITNCLRIQALSQTG